MMFVNKLLKKSIGNIETFIQNNTNHYRKLFHIYNANKINQALFKQDKQTSQQLTVRLQKSQIQTRILKILSQGNFVDIQEFQFQHDIRKTWNLDQLSITALISSIQQQFGTIFDIHVYQDVKNLTDVVQLLQRDQTIV